MRHHESPRPGRGFTLVELLVVMVVIGILIALILTAAMGGVRTAELRATQALIAKLEAAMTDRLDALTMQRAEPSNVHLALATVYNTGPGTTSITTPNANLQRAQVLAQYDFLRAELPDVFYFPQSSDPDYNSLYPINFGMHQFPTASGITFNFVLPLGTGALGSYGTGMNGASYLAAGGLYKNLGQVPQNFMPTGVSGMQPVQPKGYDGIDNGGVAGFIDDFAEGANATYGNLATVNAAAANHAHKTARAEMLYALLVEARGPLGSVFNSDDFTNREVQDTDHDGLPEFVDAWGEPLYFYRWPVYVSSDIQKGAAPYANVFETREQDPLDPSQQLLAPSWWSTFNQGPSGSLLDPAIAGPQFNSSTPLSGGAVAFEFYFHPLRDPNAGNPSLTQGQFWDRGLLTSPFIQRRAFYSKFLIVSSGPDRELGIMRLDTYNQLLSVNSLMLESLAIPITNAGLAGALPSTLDSEAWQDDIVSHNLQSTGAVQ